MSKPPLSTNDRRIAAQAVARAGRLDAIRARQAELEAELERPSQIARELVELEQAERAAAYSADLARKTIVAELRDARAEFEEARDASLSLLPAFVDVLERAHAARGRLDAAQRRAKNEGFPPVPRLGLRGQRDLLQRWLRVSRKGFDF